MYAKSELDRIALDDETAGIVDQVDDHTWIAHSRSTENEDGDPKEYTVTRNQRSPRNWNCTCPATTLCWHVRRTLRQVLRDYGHRVTQFTTNPGEARRQHRPFRTYYRNGRIFYVVISPAKRTRLPDYIAIKYMQATGRGLGFNVDILEVRWGNETWRPPHRHLTLVEFTQWAIDQGLRFESRSHYNQAYTRLTTEIWRRLNV